MSVFDKARTFYRNVLDRNLYEDWKSFGEALADYIGWEFYSLDSKGIRTVNDRLRRLIQRLDGERIVFTGSAQVRIILHSW